MRVAVLCEFSGVVRDAFAARGHQAFSVDLVQTERLNGTHFISDVRVGLVSSLISHSDMVIAFPPCTYLCASGARWWSQRKQEQERALEFVRYILSLPVGKIALENPVGRISTAIRKPDQIIQPWQFGHGETKATCLWLKNLPPLKPTNIVSGRDSRIHKMPESSRRARERSRTFQGVAEAMAAQWG